jgi:AraC family transcriptional regulator, regulatory protein of adaptative response / methylated-DNA-[protein]-cysteine methyltransferase
MQVPRAQLNPSQCWSDVQLRDAAADGKFCYAVTTTGVYCIASCPSRRPARRNVEFFANAQAAENAGYRACLRCKPKLAPRAQREAEIVAALCRYIDAAELPPCLDELSRVAQRSKFYVHRLFRAITGLTPKAYADAQRGRRMQNQVVIAKSVTEAIYSTGFNSSSQFYSQAKSQLGMTPTQLRLGAAEIQIHAAVVDCSLGKLLVAQTKLGVCCILLGSNAAELRRDCQRRFPKAMIDFSQREHSAVIKNVVALIDNPRRSVKLSLDVQGTTFQHRVWRALRDIPSGTTMSYQELAIAIGAPTAARAVATACAANPVAVAIPCHRVVRSNGDLSGYRWGVDRKRELLKREQVRR